MKHKSIPGVVLSSVIGIVVFLIFLGLVNFLANYVSSEIYQGFTLFLNNNLPLFIMLFLFGLVSEIFWILIFPFNIVAPIISAVYGIFIVTFFYRLWLFLDGYANIHINIPLNTIYGLVFWLVLIFGYITLLSRFGRRKKHEEYEKREFEEKIEKEKESRKVNWHDVGNEFKLALYNLGKALQKAFEPKKENKPKVKKRKKRK